jgi:DNA gyrase subunit A
LAKNKKREREVYDIEELKRYIAKNSRESEPADYNGEKMAIYGANVNLKRHICEIKDGLKPVQRRALITMHDNKLYPGKRSKSAQVVGDILKKYHPHGDSSAYSSIVYIGQIWRNNIPLVETDTNFGSAYEPDGYASYRYTDCGLSKFAYDCFFKEWKFTNPKDDMTVDWGRNYDSSLPEPLYLPSKYPLFLLNWHKAMGYGRYTSTPGFNLIEAFEGVIKLIEDPDADVVMYPEDPKGCTIINKKDLIGIMDKTDIKVRVRATYAINHYDGHDVIEINSVPFEVSPATVKAAIKKLAERGELPEILDIDGSSDNLGKEFILSIKVRKGYDPDAIMTKLYKKTQLDETYVTKYAFVNGGESVDYTLRTAILEWLRYRRQTIKRAYKIRRINNLKRIHFLVPLIQIIQSGEIEEFITVIRKNTAKDAISKVMKKYNLTDYQAEKIVDVKISDLSTDKLESYIKERDELIEEESELAEITKSKKMINKIIIKELREGIEKYGNPRKSKVCQMIDSIKIPDTWHYLIFTNRYVKKLPYDEKGYKVGRLDMNEKILKVIGVNNRDRIAIFTKDGKCLPIDVNDIGNSSTQSVGISYTQLGCKDNAFCGVIKICDDNINKYITSVTEDGLISKTPYNDIIEKKKVFSFMKLGKNDRMSNVCISNKKDRILIFTKQGYSALFSFGDFETTSINTKGVQSAKLKDSDKVIGVISFSKDMEHLLILTDRGYMKKISIDNLPDTKRAGKCIELNTANGALVDVLACNMFTEVSYISTSAGVFEIDPEKIKVTSRVGKNARIVELKQSDYAFELD